MGEAYDFLADFANLGVADSRACSEALGLQACKAHVVQLAEETIQRAQKIRGLPRTGNHSSQDISHIGALSASCHRLTQACQLWNDAAIQPVCDLVSRQVDGDAKLQEYFKSEIRSIVKSFQTYQPHNGMLHRVLEECYIQASSPSGTLHTESYFDTLEESYLVSPYDPEFESEQYYEHENRLEVDEDYAAAHRAQQLRQGDLRKASKKSQQKSWALAWLRALQECAEGPTLFRLLTDIDAGASPSRWTEVPRYLIRVSDPSSPGSSNAQVVASVACASGATSLANTKDICAMEPAVAALRLRIHLAPTSFIASGDPADNLMSWTSSLLFAIQYAIYRHHRYGHPTEQIQFCVVDTGNFPRGQFARDMCLLHHVFNDLEEDSFCANLEDIIELRENKGYDNGEYLTQGIVHLEGRSRIFSLKDLVDAGLYSLYPAFSDEGYKHLWTRRVKDLRSQWSRTRRTRYSEIRLAIGIAAKCFTGLHAIDMALLVLTLTNRDREDLQPQTSPVWKPSDVFVVSDKPRKGHGLEQYGPDEVQRFVELSKALESKRRDPFSAWIGRMELMKTFKCAQDGEISDV